MSDTVWLDPSIPPATPKGTERYFIVAVRRADSGKVWTFPAQYLNAYPLFFEVCGCEGEPDGHLSDGCPCTGWYSASSDGEYDENYSPLLSPGDELIAWSEIQLHPMDARLAPEVSPTDEKIEEMLAGLEGVTPGPWNEGDKWVFVSPRSGEPHHALENVLTNQEAQTNAAHIARCDPDTMHSILTELQSLRALSPNSEWEAVAWLSYIVVATDEPKLVFAHPEADGAFPVYTRPQPQQVEVSYSLGDCKRLVEAVLEHCQGPDWDCDTKAAVKSVRTILTRTAEGGDE